MKSLRRRFSLRRLARAGLVAALMVTAGAVGARAVGPAPVSRFVALPDEVLRELPRLPAGAEIGSWEELEGGWVVTAEVPTRRGHDLALLEGAAGRVRRLPAPAERRGALRGGAVPLTDGRQLLGLAWLEGDGPETLAVQAARWSGLDWQDVETVSAAGAGSQVGLAGAVLADGSWLLVWTRFDGEDDETVWSLGGPGGWSVPAPLHGPNPVPDITPAVTPLGGGALAAWSRFEDGHYRLRLAVLEDGVWREAAWAGEAGSLFPTLAATASGAAVLFETVLPHAWSVVEVGAGGRVVRRATARSERTERPRLEAWEGAEAVLTWPAGDGVPASEARPRWEVAP